MKISIVPGINNSGHGHWQTNWQLKYGYTRVEQENWERPDFLKWKRNLIEYLKKDSNERANFLVAHSLGCLLTVKSLPEIREYIKGIFLVAPADPNGNFFPEQLNGFKDLPEEELGIPGYLVYSENDPYASPAFSEKYGRIWGLKTFSIGKKGHINSESDLGDWNEGFELFSHILEGAFQY